MPGEFSFISRPASDPHRRVDPHPVSPARSPPKQEETMSKNKETNAKTDLLSPLTEECKACMALLLNAGVSLGSTIAVCFDLALEKLFQKRPRKL